MIDISALPEHRRSDGRDGYVYVIEFSTGIVKVGKTRNPRARIASHVDDAKKFGATVDQLWLSDLHENYSDNERSLIRTLRGADSVAHGNEYLRVDFAESVGAATQLPFKVLTEQERETRDRALDERSERAAEALLGWSPAGRRFTVSVGDELTASVLHVVFAESLPRATHRSEDPVAMRAKIRQYAEESGQDVDDVLNWSYTDAITHLAEMAIKAGCLQLRIMALESERYDLTHEPFFGGAA